jgi:hypothetical protein
MVLPLFKGILPLANETVKKEVTLAEVIDAVTSSEVVLDCDTKTQTLTQS